MLRVFVREGVDHAIFDPIFFVEPAISGIRKLESRHLAERIPFSSRDAEGPDLLFDSIVRLNEGGQAIANFVGSAYLLNVQMPQPAAVHA